MVCSRVSSLSGASRQHTAESSPDTVSSNLATGFGRKSIVGVKEDDEERGWTWMRHTHTHTVVVVVVVVRGWRGRKGCEKQSDVAREARKQRGESSGVL